MGIENRRFIRLREQLVVTFQLSTWKEPRRSLTLNISGGGLAFVADHPLREKTIFSRTLKLPDREKPISFEGEVIWSRDSHTGVREYELPKTQLGIQFVKIEEKDRKLIDVFARINAAPNQD